MAKIEITRPELVWPGKYNEDGSLKETPRVNLPFQVIETINESRATREMKGKKSGSLFDVYQGNEGDTFEEGWRNKLIWGDNLLTMSSLLDKFAGKIDLIYIDPPFATGADFTFTTYIGENDVEIEKEQSAIEEKAYRDTWGAGLDSYLAMMYQRFKLMHALLSNSGSIYVHLDWHFGHYIKVILDEVFGDSRFRNEIIREKTNPKNYTKAGYGNIHDVIFFYTKTDEAIWNKPYVERSEAKIAIDFPHIGPDKRRFKTAPLHAPGIRKGETGKPWRNLRPPTGNHWRYVHATLEELDRDKKIEWSSTGNPRERIYADESSGMFLQDVWMGVKDSKGDYPSMKNPELLERIIKASSNEHSLVLDCFGGSGTTAFVAENLRRRWISCDLGRYAIHTTRKRLLDIEDCRPFEILNLGKYERQYWQGITFGKGKNVNEQAVYEYLAFILKLYRAQPISGMVNLHGKRGKAMVHIGAIDAPVTIDEVNACLDECIRAKQSELHILGWEWEMGLNDLMASEAKSRGIKLLLLQIPREVMEQQAVDKGDIQFFELAFVEVDIKAKKLTTTATLKDFVIPNTELVPEDVRRKVKKWSDYIDYWAIDWNFQNDTFMQSWVTYRTRKDRSLVLTSDSHTYEKRGTYRVLVKVVDIFGNDTTQGFDVEVA